MANTLVEMGLISVPTPEPFDANRAERQRENLAYVLNQILAQMSQNNVLIDIPENFSVNVAGNMEGVEDAIRDLLGTSWSVKIGPVKFTKHGTVGLVAVEEG